MDVLVTGVDGFIGSHVAEHMKTIGHTVIGFSRKKPLVDVDTWHSGDLRDAKMTKKLPRVDCVHHSAAITDPWDASPDLFTTNITGTQRLLEYARLCDALFVFSSSAAVYGNLPAPHREDGDVQPNNNYSLSKLVGERLLQAYTETYGMATVALRYFNTYGVRDDTKGKTASMVYHFLSSALREGAVTLYGDGTQKRDFICVKDTVRLHEKVMGLKGFTVLNTGSGISTPYTTLIAIIRDVLGKDIAINYVPNPLTGYQTHTEADITAAKNAVGWEPHIALKDGIQWMADYYKRF